MMPGGPALTRRRQSAIDVLLRLMGCTDARSSQCEHVAAISELAEACFHTVAVELAGAMVGETRRGGRLSEERIIEIAASLKTETAIRAGATGHREGRL